MTKYKIEIEVDINTEKERDVLRNILAKEIHSNCNGFLIKEYSVKINKIIPKIN